MTILYHIFAFTVSTANHDYYHNRNLPVGSSSFHSTISPSLVEPLPDEIDEEEYDDMELLERLEILREDMEELDVTTLAEVIKRIKELHQQLDGR
jgi:hypothetical protein